MNRNPAVAARNINATNENAAVTKSKTLLGKAAARPAAKAALTNITNQRQTR